MLNLKALVPGQDPLASDVNQLVQAFAALIDLGLLTLLDPQATAAAPAAAANGAGNLNGAYDWVTVLITGWKQDDGSFYVQGFAPSSASAQVTITNGQASITNIAAGGTGTIGRAVYRTAAGGVAGTEKFAFVIWDNVTTSWNDNVADASLGTGMPGSGSTPAAYGTAIPANVPTGNTTGTSMQGLINSPIVNPISLYGF